LDLLIPFFWSKIENMDAILEAIQHLWGKPWFHEVLIFIFFACIFLGYKISETEKYLRWRVKRNPKDFQAHLNLAKFLSEFEDSYEESELEFKKALEIEPKNRDALYDLYLVQNKAGKIESAEKTISDLIQFFPNDSTVSIWAGRHYTDKDNIKAEEFYTKANSLAPDSQFIQESIGYFLQKQNRIEEAIDTFTASLKTNPHSVHSLRWIVTLLSNSKRNKEAEEYARKLISISSNNSNDYHILGLVLYYLDKNREAETVLRKAIKLNPKDMDLQTDLAKVLNELSRGGDAEDIYIKAINLEPTNHLLHRKFGDYLQKNLRFDDARKSYEKAIELNQNDFGSYYNLGVMLLGHLNKLEEAEIYLNKAIDINQDFAIAHAALGDLYFEREQFSDAEKAFRKAFSINPKDNYVLEGYAKLLIKLRRAEEAINMLLLKKNNDPADYFIYTELATAYKAVGKQTEMLESLETSRSLIKQNSKNHWYDLACVESIAGNIDLAFGYLRKSKEENQLDSKWAWEDSDLDWIRDDSRFVEIVGEKPQEKLFD
jgi:tetratricopeptide (TPR) repeat protein